MNILILVLTTLLFFETNVHATGIGFSAASDISLPNVDVNSSPGFFGLQLGGPNSNGNPDLVGSFNVNGGSRFDSSFSSRTSLDDGDQIKANAEAAGKNFVNAIRDGVGGIFSAIGNSFGSGSRSNSNSGLEISYSSASNRNKAKNSNRGNANTNVELNFNGRSDPSRSSNVGAYSNTNFRTDSRANSNVELNLPTTRVNTNFNTNFRSEPRGNVEVNFNNRNNAPRVSATSNNAQRNPVRTTSNFEVNFSNRNNAPRATNNYNNNFRTESLTNGKSTNVEVNFSNRNNLPARVSQSAANYNYQANNQVRTNGNAQVNFNNRNNPSKVSQSANYNFQTKPVKTNTNVEINFSNRNSPAKVSQSANYNLQSTAKANTNLEFNLPARVNFNSNFRTEPKSNVEVNFNNRNDRTRVSANTNTNFRPAPTRANSNVEVNFNNRNDRTRVSSNTNTNFRPAPTRANSNIEVNFDNRINNPSRVSANSNSNVKVNPTRGNSKTSFEISFTSRKDAPRVDTNSNFKTKAVSIGGDTGFELNFGSRQQGKFQTASQKQVPVQNGEISFNNRNEARVTTRKPIVKVQETKEQDFPENSREVALNTFGEINLSDENQAYSRSTLDVLKQRERYDEAESGINFGGGLGMGSNIRSHTVSSSSNSRNSEPVRSSGTSSISTRGGISFTGATSGTGRLTTDQIFKSSAEKRPSRLSTDQIFKSSEEKRTSGTKFNSGADIGTRFRAGGRLENSRDSDFDRRSNGRVSLKTNDRDSFNIGGASELGLAGSSRSTAGTRISTGRTGETTGNGNLGLNFKNNRNIEHRVISTVNSESKSSIPDRLSGEFRFEARKGESLSNGRDNPKKSVTTERRIITTTKSKTGSKIDSDPRLSSSGRANFRAGSTRDASSSTKIRNSGGGYGNLDFSIETKSDSLISAGGGRFVEDSRELRGDIFVGNTKQDRRGNADFSIASKSNTRSDSTGRDRFRSSDRDNEFRGRNSGNAKFTADLKAVGKSDDFLTTIKSKAAIGNSRLDLGSRHSSAFPLADSTEIKSDLRISKTSRTSSRFSTDLNLENKDKLGGNRGSSFRSDFRAELNQPSTELGIRARGNNKNSGEFDTTLSKRVSTTSSSDSGFEIGSRGLLNTELGFESQSDQRSTSSTGNANARSRSSSRLENISVEDNEKIPFGVPLSISGESVLSVGANVKTAPKVRFSYRR